MVMEWCFHFLLQVSLSLQLKRIIPALRRAGVALNGGFKFAGEHEKSRIPNEGPPPPPEPENAVHH